MELDPTNSHVEIVVLNTQGSDTVTQAPVTSTDNPRNFRLAISGRVSFKGTGTRIGSDYVSYVVPPDYSNDNSRYATFHVNIASSGAVTIHAI